MPKSSTPGASKPSTDWEHDGDLDVIAHHIIECADRWEPHARLLGNARAEDVSKVVRGLMEQVSFYRRRCDLLQSNQSRMRDPERTLVCDILANAILLPDPDGKRYGPKV